MRNFIHTLAILALITAVISPACRFISGQMIEICAADGRLKTIFVAPENAPPEMPAPHKKADPCAFCFAQSHMKSLSAGLALIAFYVLLISTLTAAWLSGHPARYELSALSARAPPRL